MLLFVLLKLIERISWCHM